LEPQRTNAVTFSESFDNAAWSKNVSTITANNATSPDGYTNADLLSEATFTNDAASAYQTLTVTASVPYTTSVFLKQGAGRYAFLRNYYLSGGHYYTVVVDLQAGTITQATAGGSVSGASSTITEYGNGWYRVTATQTSSQTSLLPIFGISDVATPTIGSFGQITVASNNARTILLYGAQCELGAYSTSYIPTLSTAVTRVAETASKTGIASLIGQEEGTIFVEITDWQLSLDTLLFSVSDGSTSNYIQISTNSVTGNLQSVIFTGGSAVALGNTTPTAGQTIKIAVGYKVNDYALYVNGTQIGTLTSKAAPTTLTRTDIGSLSWFSSGLQPRPKFAQALLFKTRLSNADLATLTTI
jgi:hypothetical protein